MTPLINGKHDAPAIISQPEEITYSELEWRLCDFQKQFGMSGIFPGQRVAIHMDLSLRHILLILALLRYGAMACPLSTRLTTSGIGEAVKTLGADFIYEKNQSIERTSLKGIDQSPTADTGRNDEGAVAIFTSGSTGAPKAAVLSQSNLIHSAIAANERLQFDDKSSWLMSLPIYHVGGLGIVLRAMLSGGSIILPDEKNLLDQELVNHRPSHVSFVSTQLQRLLNIPNAAQQLKNCQCVLMGGSGMPEKLINQALSAGIRIHTSYGMTETAALVTSTSAESDQAELATSGTPLQKESIRINSEGCIEVGGPSRFQGYMVEGDLKEPFTDDGWFTTRDTGRFTDSGCLVVTGRVDNMFISGGENIQPETIEQALERIDGVTRSVVVPVENDEFGFRPIAFVDVIENALELNAIKAQLKNVLPGFMVPDCIFPWPKSEIDTEMKIDRFEWIDRARRLVHPK